MGLLDLLLIVLLLLLIQAAAPVWPHGHRGSYALGGGSIAVPVIVLIVLLLY